METVIIIIIVAVVIVAVVAILYFASSSSSVPTPVTPTPVNPTPVNPTPVNPTPVTPTPVNPTPVTPTPITPTPVNPTPVTPTPVTPTPVTPTPVNPPQINTSIFAPVSDTYTNPNLVAFYPFNNNLLDSSVNHYDGTMMSGSSTFVSGPNGTGAISLNGDGRYVQLPNTIFSKMSNSTSQFTFIFWVNPSSAVGLFGETIFNFGNGVTTLTSTTTNVSYMSLGMSTGGFSFSILPLGSTITNMISVTSGSIIPKTGNWYQIIVVMSPPNLTMYVNGTKTQSVSYPTGIWNSTSGFTNTTSNFIGKSQIQSIFNTFFVGDVGQFLIFNSALIQ